ncbi:MAG: WcaI family glycosyltransferase [Acidobacteriota bacterium]
MQVDEAVRLGLVKNRTAGWALRGIETFFLKNADRVTTITQAMRRRIVEKGVPEENTWLFPNWADIGHMRPGSKDTEFRRTLGISLDDVLVMYAGNMGDKQGLEIVLQAAHRLREHPEIRFVMIGAGAARARMESMAKRLDLPNLQFLPVQPLEKLPEIFASSDLHLVVQKREAADLVMPSKLTNICAAGRPCVATTDPGTALHDAVVGSNLGVAVPPQDEEALAASIERLAADSPRRVEMGRNARVFAQEKLDKETILKEFETHLKKLTAGF